VVEQRYRAVLEVAAGVPVTGVAGRYGVSRQSVHAWLRRYRDEGPSGLADRSHRVRVHPWQMPAEIEAAVCELHRAHPSWGPKRLVFEMDRRSLGAVTRSAVYRALVHNGLIEPRSRRRRKQDYRHRRGPRRRPTGPGTAGAASRPESGPRHARRSSSSSCAAAPPAGPARTPGPGAAAPPG
jgi:transposase